MTKDLYKRVQTVALTSAVMTLRHVATDLQIAKQKSLAADCLKVRQKVARILLKLRQDKP